MDRYERSTTITTYQGLAEEIFRRTQSNIPMPILLVMSVLATSYGSFLELPTSNSELYKILVNFKYLCGLLSSDENNQDIILENLILRNSEFIEEALSTFPALDYYIAGEIIVDDLVSELKHYVCFYGASFLESISDLLLGDSVRPADYISIESVITATRDNPYNFANLDKLERMSLLYILGIRGDVDQYKMAFVTGNIQGFVLEKLSKTALTNKIRTMICNNKVGIEELAREFGYRESITSNEINKISANLAHYLFKINDQESLGTYLLDIDQVQKDALEIEVKELPGLCKMEPYLQDAFRESLYKIGRDRKDESRLSINTLKLLLDYVHKFHSQSDPRERFMYKFKIYSEIFKNLVEKQNVIVSRYTAVEWDTDKISKLLCNYLLEYGPKRPFFPNTMSEVEYYIRLLEMGLES